MRMFHALLICTAVLALPAQAQQSKGGLDQTGPYKAVESWFKPGVQGWNQPVTGVAAESPDRIYVVSPGQQLTRPGSIMLGAKGDVLNPTRDPKAGPLQKPTHEHLILVLNGNGEVIENWSQWNKEFVLPHSVEIDPYDPEKHVW